jgi:hypothetical protein
MVDDADYDWLNQWKWRCNSTNNGFNYASRNENGMHVRMHRKIMRLLDPHIEVDHINGDGLDNRRENLRPCTRTQNNTNRGMRKTNRSGFKGVIFDPDTGKWRVILKANKRKYDAGRFSNLVDAAIAYDALAIKYHGEFAKTNRKLGLMEGVEYPP